MRKTILASALVAALPFAGVAHAEESPVSANVALVSDYTYRGISQTDERAALQGGLDYAHPSGFYLGVWGSNVSWLRDAETAEKSGNSLEIDLYGGYRGELGPIGYDVGLLQYYYPGSYDSAWKADTGLVNPNTLEGYIGLSWEFLTFKYSHSFTDLFGVDDSKGSQYYDLTAKYEVIDNLTLEAHVGYQRVKNNSDFNYTDWKVGASTSYAGLNFGLHYVDTDISGDPDLADDRVVLSISKAF